MKSKHKAVILILICLLMVRSLNGTSTIFEILDLSISLIAAYVIYNFSQFVKLEIGNSNNLNYSSWLIILSYSLGGTFIFLDSSFLEGELSNNAFTSLFIPVSFFAMIIGNLWLGIFLLRHNKLLITGVGFIVSILSFIIVFLYNTNQNLLLNAIGQFINYIPYLLILSWYLNTKKEKNNANLS